MDNKPTEKLGETYIKSRLLKYDFDLHSDLSYDKSGADLIITEKLNDNKLHFIKIQCKSRNIKKTTNVRIPRSYVNVNFVLFVYLIDTEKNEHLYCFYENDIKSIFRKTDIEFTLNFSFSKLINFEEYIFNQVNANKLKHLFKELKKKKFTTIIIDGIFLMESIVETKKFYSSYWKRQFPKPKLHDIIKKIILRYNRFDKNENDIACYLYVSNYHPLKDHLTIENEENNFIIKNEISVKTFVTHSNEFVAFQIMDDISRFKDSNNIILVANDIIYEKFLKDLENEVDEIIIMRLKMKERPNEMYVNYRWGKISEPIGLSMGLTESEL